MNIFLFHAGDQGFPAEGRALGTSSAAGAVCLDFAVGRGLFLPPNAKLHLEVGNLGDWLVLIPYPHNSAFAVPAGTELSCSLPPFNLLGIWGGGTSSSLQLPQSKFLFSLF